MISLFNTVPVCNGEGLSTVPKCKKVVPHPVEKIQFRSISGLSYSAVGREFNVNESTIC